MSATVARRGGGIQVVVKLPRSYRRARSGRLLVFVAVGSIPNKRSRYVRLRVEKGSRQGAVGSCWCLRRLVVGRCEEEVTSARLPMLEVRQSSQRLR